MRSLWVLCVMSACSSPTNEAAPTVQSEGVRVDDAGTTDPAVPSEVSEVPVLPTEPVWPTDPDVDYPIYATDDPALVYLMEEPNRGPWVTRERDETPEDATVTRHVHCEVVPPTLHCSAAVARAEVEPGSDAAVWTVARVDGVIHAAYRAWLGDDEPTTWLWVYNDAGQLERLTTLDARSIVQVAHTFNDDATLYRARRRSGANALNGCGIWRAEVDDQGRVVRETCLSWGNEPLADDEGVVTRQHRYGSDGFVSETRFLDGSGRAAVAHSGAERVRFERDAVGRVREQSTIGPNGVPVVSAVDGCASWRTTYTPHGRVASASCFDTDGTAKRNSNRVSIIRYGYDSAGNRDSERYYGRLEEPAGDRYGVHARFFSTDSVRRVTRRACSDIHNEPHECEPGGATAVRNRYDFSRGPTHRQDYLAANGSWAADPRYGVPSIHVRYDLQGRQIRLSCLDHQGESTPCGGTGFSVMEDRYDDAGREVSTVFFDENGQRTSNLDTWERQYLYDSYDRLVEARTIPTPGTQPEFAARRLLYDTAGRLSAVLLFDMGMAPARYANCFTQIDCPPEPWHAARVVRDTDGNAISNVYYDADGHQISRLPCDAGRCWE